MFMTLALTASTFVLGICIVVMCIQSGTIKSLRIDVGQLEFNEAHIAKSYTNFKSNAENIQRALNIDLQHVRSDIRGYEKSLAEARGEINKANMELRETTLKLTKRNVKWMSFDAINADGTISHIILRPDAGLNYTKLDNESLEVVYFNNGLRHHVVYNRVENVKVATSPDEDAQVTKS